jgi:hypothetical protein
MMGDECVCKILIHLSALIIPHFLFFFFPSPLPPSRGVGFEHDREADDAEEALGCRFG